jgi:hypothetical protein
VRGPHETTGETSELDRLEQLVVDADLGRPRRRYTPAEHRFRDIVDEEIATARARGRSLDFDVE